MDDPTASDMQVMSYLAQLGWHFVFTGRWHAYGPDGKACHNYKTAKELLDSIVRINGD